MILFTLDLLAVLFIAAPLVGYGWTRGALLLARGKLVQLVNENRVAGTLAAAGLFVAWFGGWVAIGAVKLLRDAVVPAGGSSA